MTRVDVTDKQYQVSDNFPPNKASTWPYPEEKDGWVHAHNSLRGELSHILGALEDIQKRGALKEWEMKAIVVVIDGHLEHIHSHHSNEDDIFIPFFKQRFHYPKRLEKDHDVLEKKLDTIEAMIKALQDGDMVDDLVSEWREYREWMLPHLQEEEEIGLPLSRAYFEPKDVAPMIQQLVAKSSKFETGSMIYFMGQETFRNEFMIQENIPSFVWYIDFQSKYKLFLNDFVMNLEALKSGEEPTRSVSSGCSIL